MSAAVASLVFVISVVAGIVLIAIVDARHARSARQRANDQARRHFGLRPDARCRSADVQRDGVVFDDGAES